MEERSRWPVSTASPRGQCSKYIHNFEGKGEDVLVCLPGAITDHVTERIEQIIRRGNGGGILVHNANKEGTTGIVEKCRNILKKTKEARVGQRILSGMFPVLGNRCQGYRNSKRMAVKEMVKRLCKEGEVAFVDFWDSFVGKEKNVRERWPAS